MDFRELFAVSKRRDTTYDSDKAQKVNHFLFDLVRSAISNNGCYTLCEYNIPF